MNWEKWVETQIKEGISNFNLREHSLRAFARINSLFSEYSPINNRQAQTSLFADSSNASQKEEKKNRTPYSASSASLRHSDIPVSPP